MAKPRLLLILRDLSCGGVETAFLTKLRFFDRDQYDVKLFCLNPEGPLSARVPVEDLFNCRDTISGRITRWAIRKGYLFWVVPFAIFRIRQAVDAFSSDVVIGSITEWNLMTGLALRGRLSGVKWFPVEGSNTVYMLDRLSAPLRGIVRWAVATIFRRADRVVLVSQGAAALYSATFGLPMSRLVSIYNPVDVAEIRHHSRSGVQPVITAVGRLEVVKRFDVVIQAFSRSKLYEEGVRLQIVGDGSQRETLAVLIKELGLGDSVELTGFIENPWSVLAKSSLFVVSSDSEGGPNVLFEAMAMGVPVVSTRCGYAVTEFITHRENGMLVPIGDVESLSDAMREMMQSPEFRNQCADLAAKSVEHCDGPVIMRQYERMIDDVLAV